MYLLGYDIGSSSIKVALIEADSQRLVGVEKYPAVEMDIISKQLGWAEQNPEQWWENVCLATKALIHKTEIDPGEIISIGISYQMHGLVLVDKEQQVLRPSIIWCDSRAVEIGKQAFDTLGHEQCLTHFLNSPGNFTASKLKWVKESEPEIYDQIHKLMLPGDFIAMKLTGEINTTVTGLSEGVLWDFKSNRVNKMLLDHYGISGELVPEIVDAFSAQGKVTKWASEQIGLKEGTPICYRAGDQPNNALSLGVFKAGQVAATAGTSGVVYGILDHLAYDKVSRVNSFAHVNHNDTSPSIGMLLCINGAGIQYAWMRKQIASSDVDYEDMERLVSAVPVGSDGLRILPFGNGSERMLENAAPGAQINNLQFNRHTQAHLFRAALESIAFSFVYGFQILKDFGLDLGVIKVGNDNLFQSDTFSQILSNLLDTPIELVNTTGAVGAAKASGYGLAYYSSLEESFSKNEQIKTIEPESSIEAYKEAYQLWEHDLKHLLGKK